MIEKYLDDLESRLDDAGETAVREQWMRFINDEIKTGIFTPIRPYKAPAKIEWPRISVNTAIGDFDQMILAQLADCSSIIATGDTGNILNVRANYGTGILSSVFGAKIFWMEDALNTLPTSEPLTGGTDAIKRLLDAGIPDLHTGFGGKTFEMGRRFVEAFAPYPKISKWINIYHPDIQGPIDVAELVWGSSIFCELIDQPELVHAFLDLVTQTYTKYLHKWNRIVAPMGGGVSSHWGLLHKGTIMLRDDSAMNLSGEMFEEFVRPYDQRLLDEFGGGAIHFCGHGDHFIPAMTQMHNLHSINLSQPHLNDMECIYRHTVDKGITIIDLDRNYAEATLAAGRDLRGRVNTR